MADEPTEEPEQPAEQASPAVEPTDGPEAAAAAPEEQPSDPSAAEPAASEAESAEAAAEPDASASEPGADKAVAANESDEPLDLGYRVALDRFTGPLDLLLHLVRRAEVDITDIPVSTIADQFVEAVAAWEDMDLEVAGEFILMAATLLEIKARLIMPPSEDEDDGEADEKDLVDPRADLIGQLLAYRATKASGQVLESLEDLRGKRHSRRLQEVIPEDPETANGVDLDNADPYQLYKVWEQILSSIAGNQPRRVVYDDVPIEERVRKLEETMRTTREAQLAWLLAQEDKPVHRVGVVVATLQGIRRRFIDASQHEQYGPVTLHFIDERDRTPGPDGPPPPEEEPEHGKKKKRRRRPPLITWRPPEGGTAEVDGQEPEPVTEEEEIVESDETRFLRELNEATSVDRLLYDAAHLDERINAHLVAEGILEPEPEPESEVAEEGAAGASDEEATEVVASPEPSAT